MDIKQYATEQSKDHRINQKRTKKYLETKKKKKSKHGIPKLVMSGKAVLREKFSDKCLHQEKRMISNKQPNLTPQRTRKRRKNKAQSQQKEGNRDHKVNKRNRQIRKKKTKKKKQ